MFSLFPLPSETFTTASFCNLSSVFSWNKTTFVICPKPVHVSLPLRFVPQMFMFFICSLLVHLSSLEGVLKYQWIILSLARWKGSWSHHKPPKSLQNYWENYQIICHRNGSLCRAHRFMWLPGFNPEIPTVPLMGVMLSPVLSFVPALASKQASKCAKQLLKSCRTEDIARRIH